MAKGAFYIKPVYTNGKGEQRTQVYMTVETAQKVAEGDKATLAELRRDLGEVVRTAPGKVTVRKAS